MLIGELLRSFGVNALALGRRETNGGLVGHGVGKRTKIIHDELQSLAVFYLLLSDFCTC